ncbi:hypothetical protein EEW87_004325 [Janibacter melonis]|uniref:Uncharacterized protein n=1 Tax=Janibacter melonis TaxID=262209 RepID=A0A5P8FJJ4_9MICO|nr:hypothetical protein [Janibacter melonis]QFQ29725.2 hypothetical protein EEW87_004325 [Janibacter melonis]
MSYDPPTEAETKETWRRIGEALAEVHRTVKPVIDRLEAQEHELTSGDAMSTRRHRPRRTR